jgi:hypothetical protein
MGIELTYIPLAIQTAIDRGAVINPQQSLPGEEHLCSAFARLMAKLVEAKKIPTYKGVHTDPGCVEVQTRPYRKLTTLINIARRLRREAEALGMVTEAAYTNGGGAHIHTGIIGDSEQERNMYAKRMMLFAAMNPWLCWATLNVNDDINAMPICEHHLKNCYGESEGASEETYSERVTYCVNELVNEETALHARGAWMSAYTRERNMRDVRYAQREVMGFRKQLFYYRRANSKQSNGVVSRNVKDIQYIGNKDHMVRLTTYGKFGTAEFRCFEMGGEDKLKSNIILANAICKYVERWDVTQYDSTQVMSGSAMRKIKWSEARKGWLDMLTMLGLDAADYRNETAQIAARWRYARSEGENPTAAEVPAAQALHERREDTTARDAARAQRRWMRRLTRSGRHPMCRAVAPTAPVDDIASLAA